MTGASDGAVKSLAIKCVLGTSSCVDSGVVGKAGAGGGRSSLASVDETTSGLYKISQIHAPRPTTKARAPSPRIRIPKSKPSFIWLN